jgi:hypothetical protein
MEYLGFDRYIGAVYEGDVNDGHRVIPPPLLAPIRFFHGKELSPISTVGNELATEIFREDDFDAVTKVRRGRVFKLRSCAQPHEWHVSDPYRPHLPRTQWGAGTTQCVSLGTYERHCLQGLADISALAMPAVALGWEPHITFWKVISIECNLVGTPVLSLRARHSLGDTPEILEENVPPKLLKALVEVIEKVEASTNRLAAVDVIDRCRSALSVAFGFKAGDMSKDLSQSIDGYLQKENAGRENLCSWCGRIVARLHSRGKPNEQVGKGLRPPTESDADLALNCLKTVLIEFGWAR